MKKKRIGALLAGIIAMVCLVWYGCTKEKTSDDELFGGIYGTVTDYATGDPIGNASVKLRPSGETTLTGSDGSYEFKDLKPGKYTLQLSKAEYADLDDDNIIDLEAGKRIQRNVQMRKEMASLKVTDMSGNDLPSLDFGLEESVTSKTFNIFNNGTVAISCNLSYNCVWIDTVIAAGTDLTPGQTLTVTVLIDRAKLSAGENSTFLHIISKNGSNELKITATGYGAPTVTTGNVTNITATSAKCGGSVTDDGGTRVTDRGICWGTNNMPNIVEDMKQSSGNGTGDFGPVTISHLAANTHYYVRAYATNARGTDYGGQEEFTTPDGLPSVATGSVSNVTANSADCEGTVSSQGDAAVSDRGVVYNTSGNPTIDNGTKVSKGTGTGTFSASITGLTANTTYYVRAYATNSFGTKYAEAVRQFTTPDGLATVRTDSVNNVTGNSAVCKGTVSSQGDARVTERGFVYSTTSNPTIENGTKVTKGSGTGSYSAPITGLTANKTYYVRAYATNFNGTAYGNQLEFTTPNGLPSVTTDSVSSITSNSAVCEGTVSSQGDAAVTDRGIVYSTTGNPTIDNGNKVSKGSGIGHFSAPITGLAPNTTYYVRAYATNSFGTKYAEAVKQFTTHDGTPTVVINDMGDSTATSAVCSGSISGNGGFPITEKGFVYATTQMPTLENCQNPVRLGSGDAPFTGTITGLTRNTTYYVRAYATNNQGVTGYSSEQKTFRTRSGLPTVTTTAITMNGDVAMSGGNVTSDGGYRVTARGICYGVYENPDLTSAYTHTDNGSGTGPFTSTFESSSDVIIYVRAYATNENGTAYGEQKVFNRDYMRLPTFTHDGHIYHVAPDPYPNQPEYGVSYSYAKSYCANLILYGIDGWRLPTLEELKTMYAFRETIGGFNGGRYHQCSSGYYLIVEHTPYYYYEKTSNQYIALSFGNGTTISSSLDYGTLPTNACNLNSRKYYIVGHVRPIRMD